LIGLSKRYFQFNKPIEMESEKSRKEPPQSEIENQAKERNLAISSPFEDFVNKINISDNTKSDLMRVYFNDQHMMTLNLKCKFQKILTL
jgi:hypothetical protein